MGMGFLNVVVRSKTAVEFFEVFCDDISLYLLSLSITYFSVGWGKNVIFKG
jgi:hypothetical protein